MIEKHAKRPCVTKDVKLKQDRTQSGGKKMRSEFAEWLANQATLAMLLITLLVVPQALEKLSFF